MSTSNDEFGDCSNEEFRYLAKQEGAFQPWHEHEPPLYVLFATYISYVLLICIGHVRDYFGKRFFPSYYPHITPSNVRLPVPLFFMS